MRSAQCCSTRTKYLGMMRKSPPEAAASPAFHQTQHSLHLPVSWLLCPPSIMAHLHEVLHLCSHLFYVNGCFPACISVHQRTTVAHGGQTWVLEPLELQQLWVLGTELGYSTRATWSYLFRPQICILPTILLFYSSFMIKSKCHLLREMSLCSTKCFYAPSQWDIHTLTTALPDSPLWSEANYEKANLYHWTLSG